MSYINKNNVIHVCNNTSCITVSLSFFIPQTNRITMHKHQLKLSISSWKACMQYLIKAQNVFHSFNTRDFLMKNPVDTFFFFYQPWAPPETESQSGRGRVVLSETPARVEGVCSQSVGQGNVWTSRFPRCAAPRRSHTLSAWSSEYEACRAELPAVKKKWTGGSGGLIGCGWSVVDHCINSACTHKGEVPQSKSWGVTSKSWCEKESLMCICAVKHWYQTWGWVPFYWLNLYTLIQSSTTALQ